MVTRLELTIPRQRGNAKLVAQSVFIDKAKVTSKGQVTIPEDVRAVLVVAPGDGVVFCVEGSEVRIANAAVFAMEALQRQMADVTAASKLTEDEAVELVREIRHPA